MSWTELVAKNVPLSRSSHGISIIGDILYMFGGEHEARTPLGNEVYALDLKKNPLEWTILPTQGEAPSPRFGHGQCCVGDKVVVFGGRMGTAIDEKLLNDLYLLDTKTNTWTEVVDATGDPPCPRSFHSTVSWGQSVYVFGGCPEQGRLADLYELDTTTMHWRQLESGPMEGRGGTPLAVTDDGHLFVVGGFAGREMSDIHSYSILTNTWKTHQEKLSKAVSVAVLGSINNKLMLVGGELEPSARGHAGAGNFSDQATIINVGQGRVNIEKSVTGPVARGWSSGDVWKPKEGKHTLVVVGGLCGDDTEPVRLMDVWKGKME